MSSLFPRFSSLCVIVVCLVFWLGRADTTLAQKQAKLLTPSNLIANDVADVDADYAYQGEYMGYAKTSAGTSEKLGIQVIARSLGMFDVVLLPGGLPGDGWNKTERSTYPATLSDDAVSLQTEDYQISIADNVAVLTDEEGQELGRLPKYARRSSTLGAKPPANALVLFDGKVNELWKNMKVTDAGLLEQGCETADKFGDFHLHLEFQLPYKPAGVGQDRGNSGVYLQRRYEVQVLDSFGEPGLPNQCGGIYKLHSPDQNMCLEPLAWQTYDIDFRMARFDDEGNKTENMKIRVRHNGIVIHDAIEVESKTGAGRQEADTPGPILLQDHGNPVRYRNIWLVKGDPFETPVSPVPAQLADSDSAPGQSEQAVPTSGQVDPTYGPAGGYHYYSPIHNYGPYYGSPHAYWYSSSFVDLPAYPYYGF